MKKIAECFSFLVVCLFLFSCSTFQSNSSASEKEPTGLDLSPVLIRDLTKINYCQNEFWSTSYGKMALLTPEQLKKQTFDFSLERKPACSYEQAIRSVRLIVRLSSQFSELFDSPKTSRANKIKLSQQVLETQSVVLLETPLVLGEILLQLSFVSKAIEKSAALKDKKLDELTKKIVERLKAKREDIIKGAIAYDVLVAQNVAYRMEIYDWVMLSNSSEIVVPTDEQLKMFSKQNKYAEILNLEKFKNETLQNLECVKKKECFVCDFSVDKKQCSDVKDEDKILKENLVFLKFFGAKVGDAILKFDSQTNKLLQY